MDIHMDIYVDVQTHLFLKQVSYDKLNIND